MFASVVVVLCCCVVVFLILPLRVINCQHVHFTSKEGSAVEPKVDAKESKSKAVVEREFDPCACSCASWS